MITTASARRIAKVVQAFDRDPRVIMKGQRLRTAGDDSSDAIKLGKTTTAIDRLAVGSISVYKGPATVATSCGTECLPLEFTDTGEKLCVQNLLSDLAADEWVYAINPSGGDVWHVIGRATADADKDDDSCGEETINAVTLTFEACHGTGGKAHATVDGNCPGPISGVEIDEPGEGYAIMGRAEPELIISGGRGSGATFTVTYTETAGDCDIPTWSIDSVSVDGGEGYTDGATLQVRQEAGTKRIQCAKLVIQSGSGGIPESVTVEEPGEYYKEDPDAEPYVADVTVTVSQAAPSAGAGAEFTVTIDDDPSSATFGQITGVTVDEPGDDYVGQIKGTTSVWNGLDFESIAGYDGSAVQMLGHAAGGCLAWYSITTCEEDTTGVCCIDGAVSNEHTTQAACAEAGGTWQAGASAGDLPGPCCP